MIKIYKNVPKIILTTLMAFLLISTVNQGLATVVWEETFENLDEWEFYGNTLDTEFGESIDPGFSLDNGVLTAPHYPSSSNISRAYRNSTVAYGTWSFDMNMTKTTHTVVAFMWSDAGDDANFTGRTEAQILSEVTGYSFFCSIDSPQFRLAGYFGGMSSYKQLDAKAFSSQIVGWHHFDITRDKTGQFYVFLDNDYENPILSAKDNTTTTTKHFHLATWRGAFKLDNVSVGNSVEIDYTTPTTAGNGLFTSLFIIIPVLTTLIVIRKKRK